MTNINVIDNIRQEVKILFVFMGGLLNNKFTLFFILITKKKKLLIKNKKYQTVNLSIFVIIKH